jgi:hypothetical protein
MKIDIKKCMELGLDPNSMTLLTSIQKADKEVYDYFKPWSPGSILLDLRNKNHILLPTAFPFHTFEELVALNKGKKVKDKSDPEFDKFVDAYYEVFPKGVTSGGYPVRTGKEACKTKLKKFLTENKEISKELVLKITAFYVSQMKNQDYKGIKLAPNFISKDGISTLLSVYEYLKSNPKIQSNQSNMQVG